MVRADVKRVKPNRISSPTVANKNTKVNIYSIEEFRMIEILFETIQEHREIPIRIEVLVVLHLVRVQYFTHSVSQALAMSSSKQQAFIGGAFVHKELQGFAAFVAYQKCHHSGNSVTKTMMEASIAELYFDNMSNSDSIGLAEQLVGGIGIFGGLTINIL